LKFVTGVREQLTRELLWGDGTEVRAGQQHPLGAFYAEPQPAGTKVIVAARDVQIFRRV
jgi:hypothetical protein